MIERLERAHGVTLDGAARDLSTIRRYPDVLRQVYTEPVAGGTRGVWSVTKDFKRTLQATFKTRATAR
jgi:hypothetical protein